jgi:hypothetical protein
MINWLTNLFGKNRIEELQKEIVDLKIKLQEKQEHIDKTNAYWKKRLHISTKKDKL